MNTLDSQFKQALKRENKSITKYYSGISYPCLFRKIDDNKSTTNHVSIFYEKTTPIEQGQLLTYGGKNFITLNKESVENDTYFKSTLLECNLTLPVVVNQVYTYIPSFIYDLTSPTVVESNIITTLDGTGEIITESTPIINNLSLESGYFIIGGYYELQNRHIKDGISHLFVERSLAPIPTYAFEINTNNNQYETGTTAQINTLPTINGVVDATATIEYSSSDETIATVNTSGVVSFIDDGSVTITATWTERSLTDTVTLTVVPTLPDTPDYIFDLFCSNSSNEITLGGSARTFYTTLLDGSTPVPFTTVWTFDYKGMATSNFTVTYPNATDCKITVDENYDILGNIFTVTATTNDGIYTKSIDIQITI